MESGILIPVAIIGLAMALAVGPVMWLRTSPSQKRIIRFRRRAAERKLRVQLVPSHELKLGGVAVDEALAAYWLPWIEGGNDSPSLLRHPDLRPWRLVRQRIDHESHFCGWWDWQPGLAAPEAWQAVLRRLLPSFPADSQALESNRQGIWLYWRERGDVSAVDQIADLLRELKSVGRELGRKPLDTEESEPGSNAG